jgi:hypothetical protein
MPLRGEKRTELNSMDLFLTLRKPGTLLVGSDLLNTATNGYYNGRMPWPALSDILITSRRQFVGVVLYANRDAAAVPKRLAEVSDPRIVRYLSAQEAARIPRYKSRTSDFCVLELRWSPIEPDDTEVAQLTDDWYYTVPTPGESDHPSAYGYQNVEDIFESYDIIMPESHY